MNKVDLLLLEQQRIDKLKEYGLDSESINKFKSKVKVVSEEVKMALGKELFDLISSKEYYDDENHFKRVIDLILKGANIEYKNEKKGDYALLICARKNYVNTFIVLLKYGANINQKNNYLTTATMAAARHDCRTILKILILMKADINAKCLDGDNALISARYHHKLDCFNMLVNAGAHLDVVSQDGHSIYTVKENAKFFDSPLLETAYKREITQPISFDDSNNLLEEAQSKLEEIKGASKLLTKK